MSHGCGLEDFILIYNILIYINLLSKLIYTFSAAAAKSIQSCPTQCDPKDGSPLGSAFPGILQARTLEWVAISFSANPYQNPCLSLQILLRMGEHIPVKLEITASQCGQFF